MEATIALSIVFLALEVLRTLDDQATLLSRKPWLVAFTFGLPLSGIPLALASFNIGAELGQLVFVAVVLIVLRLLAMSPHWPMAARKFPPYAIGGITMIWVFERVSAFAV